MHVARSNALTAGVRTNKHIFLVLFVEQIPCNAKPNSTLKNLAGGHRNCCWELPSASRPCLCVGPLPAFSDIMAAAQHWLDIFIQRIVRSQELSVLF